MPADGANWNLPVLTPAQFDAIAIALHEKVLLRIQTERLTNGWTGTAKAVVNAVWVTASDAGRRDEVTGRRHESCSWPKRVRCSGRPPDTWATNGVKVLLAGRQFSPTGSSDSQSSAWTNREACNALSTSIVGRSTLAVALEATRIISSRSSRSLHSCQSDTPDKTRP